MGKIRANHASRKGITCKLSRVILGQKHASNRGLRHTGKPSVVNPSLKPVALSGVRRYSRNTLKRRIGGYFSGLPCETLHKIALMLPFTSIIHLRRSSKFWYNRLTDPKFIDLHLTHALQKPPGYLFTPNYESSQGRREIYTVEQSGGDISTCKIFEYSIKWEANKQNKFQSSGGLMCVYSNQSNCFRIFNPNIGEEIQVGNVPIFKKCRHWWFFCYSPSTKEYKILKLGVLSRNNIIESTRGAICTVGSNNWREIKKNIPRYQDFNSVVECQGNLFWMKTRVMVSFDVSSEKFNVIPGPPHDDAFDRSAVRPCVSLLTAHLVNMGHTVGCIQDYRLWVLKDISESIWINRYEFSEPHLYRKVHLAGVSENGGLFGFIKRSANVFSQDIGVKKITLDDTLDDPTLDDNTLDDPTLDDNTLDDDSLEDPLKRITYVAPHVRSFVSPVRIVEMGNEQIDNDHCDVKENVPDLEVADLQGRTKRQKLKKRQG